MDLAAASTDRRSHLDLSAATEVSGTTITSPLT